MLHNNLQPAARTTTAKFTPKPTPSFMWRGQRTQYLPTEQYSAWLRSWKDFERLSPKYNQFSELYTKFDTNPLYERAIKPYKAMKREQLHHGKINFEKKANGSTRALIDQASIKAQPVAWYPKKIEGFSENLGNLSNIMGGSTSDLDKKLPIIHKIFKFHNSFQNWKKSQPTEVLKKIDPVVQEYNELYQKFRRQPLHPVLIKLIHDKQRNLAQSIAQEGIALEAI